MIKSILAVAEGGPDCAMAFRTASQVARNFGATVEAVYFAAKTADGASLGAQAMPFLAEMERTRLLARARNAKSAFAEFLAADGDNSFDDGGVVLSSLVDRGRRADLIVLGRPGMDTENTEPASVGAAIHGCARPVMIAPPDPQPRPFGSVIVAWNGSQQASRAVHHALPILARANKVAALVVDEEPDIVGAPALLTYLARHGIAASVQAIRPNAATGRSRGRALLEYVRAEGADCLVMGAYGGGQLRSFLGLGGATAKVVSACPIPLLLAH
ncbi:MAG: universal stress protein [Enhydrobacter sp.]|nr:MAG: universal stress protein [Enhydrobacter sp.]